MAAEYVSAPPSRRGRSRDRRAERRCDARPAPGSSSPAVSRRPLASTPSSPAEAADRAGLAIDGARGRALAARAQAEAGDEDGGRAKLESVRDEFSALGAGHYADQAAARAAPARRPGRPWRAPGRAGDGLDGLSGREREIAELVAAGKRNREIADSLLPQRAHGRGPPGPRVPQARGLVADRARRPGHAARAEVTPRSSISSATALARSAASPVRAYLAMNSSVCTRASSSGRWLCGDFIR